MKCRSVVLAGVLLIGCRGELGPSESFKTFEQIGGYYAGSLESASELISLNGGLSLNLTENSSGELSGNYSMTGTVTDGGQQYPLAQSGTITGKITSGSNPSINLFTHPASCPTAAANLTGTFDSAKDELTLTGPIYVFTPDDMYYCYGPFIYSIHIAFIKEA
jgi:hypothetical protein